MSKFSQINISHCEKSTNESSADAAAPKLQVFRSAIKGSFYLPGRYCVFNGELGEEGNTRENIVLVTCYIQK